MAVIYADIMLSEGNCSGLNFFFQSCMFAQKEDTSKSALLDVFKKLSINIWDTGEIPAACKQ